jgi:hypothetical protein
MSHSPSFFIVVLTKRYVNYTEYSASNDMVTALGKVGSNVQAVIV